MILVATMGVVWGQDAVFRASSDDGVLRATIDVVVEREAESLWPPLSGTGAQHAWVPYMKTASVTRVEANAIVCDGLTNLPWPFRDRTWSVRMTTRAGGSGSPYVASWEYVPGSGTLDDTSGSWALEPLSGGRTRVKLTAMADLGKPVPGPLLRWAERKALPQMVDALLEQAGRTP